jgi:hypothetical protein
MADPTVNPNPVVNQQSSGPLPSQTIPIPTVQPAQAPTESLVNVPAPFHSNAPPWYNNGVWGTLGCAVFQTGRYMHTNNVWIYEFMDVCGRQLFETMWNYDDRLFERPPSRDCLYEIYTLIKIARKRLADNAVPDGQSPLRPTHAKPAPQMFCAYPVPFYGTYGCPNSFLRLTTEMGLLMLSEAAQHADNQLPYWVSQAFAQAIGPYLQFVLVQMATRYFGYTSAQAMVPTFDFQPADWTGYNPSQWSVPVEATAVRPTPGWTPTDLDLQGIYRLPYNSVIGFLQPWPSSVLQYCSGLVWQQPAAGAAVAGTPGASNPSAATPAFMTPPGPPNLAA